MPSGKAVEERFKNKEGDPVERTSFRRKLATLSSLALASVILWPKSAAADVVLLKSENGGWEFYSSGRVNTFFSWAKGDGMPVAPLDPAGQPQWAFNGSGGTSNETYIHADPIIGPDGMPVQGHTQGTVNSMRVRSGFVGNVLGFGLRRNLDATTKVSGYTSIWSVIESLSHRKYVPNYADVREGYLKIEGPWGSVLAGKALTLFNRGATEANFLYLHGYGLGYPGSIDTQGPAAGMIGYGILASTFSAGIVYATPSLAGIQLSAGIYDPANLIGSKYDSTGPVRPEFELTVDEPLGKMGKVHLYLNGTSQKLYQNQKPDSLSETAQGYGVGARIELGPVHLAGGLHRGIGLGLTFALEPSDSTYNDLSQLRDSQGYYGMGQLALGKVDINAGFGQTKIVPLERDLLATATGFPAFSIIKTQTGYAGAVVFHAADWLHFDIDVMHAAYKWTLGDQQQVTFYNAGTTLTW
jgi:hypothetical protein